MSDWEAVATRLEYESEHAVQKQLREDIKAALEQIEELEQEKITFHGASVWADQDEALREENARLTKRVEELEEMYASLGRNYDLLEKRAEAAEAELTAFQRSYAYEKESRYQAEAEVARLEKLILDWFDYDSGDRLMAEARRIRAAKGPKGE